METNRTIHSKNLEKSKISNEQMQVDSWVSSVQIFAEQSISIETDWPTLGRLFILDSNEGKLVLQTVCNCENHL